MHSTLTVYNICPLTRMNGTQRKSLAAAFSLYYCKSYKNLYQVLQVMSAEFDRAMKSKGRVIKSLPSSALQGSAINKIPNIPHCTLPPRPRLPDPPF